MTEPSPASRSPIPELQVILHLTRVNLNAGAEEGVLTLGSVRCPADPAPSQA